MNFKIIGMIDRIETFAVGNSIRELARLKKFHGDGRWRMRKCIAMILLDDRSLRTIELHWHESSCISRKKIKIKRFVDQTAYEHIN